MGNHRAPVPTQNSECRRNSRISFAFEVLSRDRCDLAVDPLPVELACELYQFVLHIDDLLEPGSEQIA